MADMVGLPPALIHKHCPTTQWESNGDPVQEAVQLPPSSETPHSFLPGTWTLTES